MEIPIKPKLVSRDRVSSLILRPLDARSNVSSCGVGSTIIDPALKMTSKVSTLSSQPSNVLLRSSTMARRRCAIPSLTAAMISSTKKPYQLSNAGRIASLPGKKAGDQENSKAVVIE